MSSGEIIKLGGLESVEVTRTKEGVELSFRVGGVSMIRKAISLPTARRLGDALGFASIDVERGRPLPQDADSTAEAAQPFVGGVRHGL